MQFDSSEHLSQVRTAVHGASGGHSSPAVPEQCEEKVIENELEQSTGIPPGLRVSPMPEGLRTGSVKHSAHERVGCCATAVKGLAVFGEVSGNGFMAVTYNRDCQLQFHIIGNGKRR